MPADVLAVLKEKLGDEDAQKVAPLFAGATVYQTRQVIEKAHRPDVHNPIGWLLKVGEGPQVCAAGAGATPVVLASFCSMDSTSYCGRHVQRDGEMCKGCTADARAPEAA